MSNDSDDDSDLFRRAMADVKRLQVDHPTDPPPKPAPEARFTREDEARVLEESLSGGLDPASLGTGDELSFRRNHVRPGVLRDLRRGRYTIEAHLDLHGLTVPMAKEAVDGFLLESTDIGRRCVRIVHGKGHRSGHRGPVLKPKLDLWLRRRADVLAYVSARRIDGGTGAACVLLQRKGPRKPLP